jgi:putative intracellular protease/amidase
MRILFILTSVARQGGQGRPTGFDRRTFSTFYYGLQDLGAEAVIATPAGGAAPADPAGDETVLCARLRGDVRARAELADTLTLAEVFASDFDAVVFPGGPGALCGLASNRQAAALALQVAERGAPLVMVGEGAAMLAAMTDASGRPWPAGRVVAGPHDASQAAALARSGAVLSAQAVVGDGPLITASGSAFAPAALEALRRSLGLV